MSYDNELHHIGVPRKSGRYPWGSGDDPYQSKNGFLFVYNKLKGEGRTEAEIGEHLGFNSRELRQNVTWARNEEKIENDKMIDIFKNQGLSNTAIAEKIGRSEGYVRDRLKKQNPAEAHKELQFENIQEALRKGVANTGYLDVGIGIELQLGVARNKMNAAVNKLIDEEGYFAHEMYVPVLADKGKWTTIKVLTKNPEKDYSKVDLVRPLDSWSDDRGETIHNINEPVSYDINKLKVRYSEEQGTDKDGLIELRPGVQDLDMGASHYAQVRIRVDGDRFLKGMAVYGDEKDFPPGVDIIFNTNKSNTTPVRDVLKKTKPELDNMFGSSVTRQNESNILNIVNEEGDWDTWGTGLSSQFLSKQSTTLVKERLTATNERLGADLNEILALTNPLVKKHLLSAYSESLDSNVKKLQADGLPKTKSHVILPFPNMNPNEVFAPRYENGEKVVLIRHPHGGTFELPEVTVNNKNPEARRMIGTGSPDAIGVHPSVAVKLSGADFDGDTVYVVPNKQGDRHITTSRSLKELKNFDPMKYKVPYSTVIDKDGNEVEYKTITNDRTKQTQMGMASNLITDMTIKGAIPSELARAVKHSMVVIDAQKHNLDFKQSYIDNNIAALKRTYQRHDSITKPGTKTTGASTIISRSKDKVKLIDPTYDASKDRSKRDPEKNVYYPPEILSSGSKVEGLYVEHINKIQTLKNISTKALVSIKNPTYDPQAAKIYKKEVDSLSKKLDEFNLNAPRERQAQILAYKLYHTSKVPDMEKDARKKLKARSLARARATTSPAYEVVDPKTGRTKVKHGAKSIEITPKEWEAIQANSMSVSKTSAILLKADQDSVRSYATPKIVKENSAKAQRAKGMLANGNTYAEVSKALGLSLGELRGIVVGDE